MCNKSQDVSRKNSCTRPIVKYICKSSFTENVSEFLLYPSLYFHISFSLVFLILLLYYQHCSSSSFFIILSRAIVLFDDPTLAFLLLSNRESCNVVSEWGSMATVSCTLVPVLTPSSSPSSLPPYTFYMKGNLRFPLDCFGLAVFKIYSAFHEKAR